MTAKSIPLVLLLFGSACPGWTQDINSNVSGSVIADPSGLAGSTMKSTSEFRSVDEEVQAIKNEVLDLNADLYLLEDELLFPANSQVAFFLSMDVGEYFDLESVRLEIDGKEVASYLYTEREVGALHRGGVQRLHIENLAVGSHELTVILAGESSRLKSYRRNAATEFDKRIGAKYVELEITDRVARQQPEFVIREWE